MKSKALDEDVTSAQNIVNSIYSLYMYNNYLRNRPIIVLMQNINHIDNNCAR